MTSRTGSLINFRGEPREERFDLCFMVRGELTLLGDSGGVLPAGKREGNGLTPAAFEVPELPGVPKELPAFASSIRDFTCPKYISFRHTYTYIKLIKLIMN